MLTLRSAAGSWLYAPWLVFVPWKSPLATMVDPTTATERARTGCGGFGVAVAATLGSAVGDVLGPPCGNALEPPMSRPARTTSGRMLRNTGRRERMARARRSEGARPQTGTTRT